MVGLTTINAPPPTVAKITSHAAVRLQTSEEFEDQLFRQTASPRMEPARLEEVLPALCRIADGLSGSNERKRGEKSTKNNSVTLDRSRILNKNVSPSDRFIYTTTSPEEFCEKGIARFCSKDDLRQSKVFYLVDDYANTDALIDEFKKPRDTYLAQVRIVERKGEIVSTEVTPFETESNLGKEIADTVKRFKFADVTEAQLAAPLVRVDNLSINPHTEQDLAAAWNCYRWREAGRKLLTGVGSIAAVAGFIAFISRFPSEVFNSSVWLNVLSRLVPQIALYTGVNLTFNNLSDASTNGRIENAYKVLTSKQNDQIKLLALISLQPEDYPYLIERIQKGYKFTFYSRYEVKDLEKISPEQYVRMLTTIGSEALKHRQELEANGEIVPPPRWFIANIAKAAANIKGDKGLYRRIQEVKAQLSAYSLYRDPKSAAV